jgi:hypothetical protein
MLSGSDMGIATFPSASVRAEGVKLAKGLKLVRRATGRGSSSSSANNPPNSSPRIPSDSKLIWKIKHEISR